MSRTASWRSVAAVAAGVAVALLAADVGLARWAPAPPPLLEVEEAVQAYRAGDPDTLVLGSSHTRAFAPLAQKLAAEGGARLALVPVESGSFVSYEWVLRHRLLPLIDAAAERRRLSRVLLITTFNDRCPSLHVMLPARAWRAGDFLSDFVRHGLTSYNRNYLQQRIQQWLHRSRLVVERSTGGLALETLRRQLRSPAAEAAVAAQYRDELRHSTEERAACDDAGEHAALLALLDELAARGLDVTIVVFPLMPALVSDVVRTVTQQRYLDALAALPGRERFRVVDLGRLPVVDGDFMDDDDHLNAAGSRKLAGWLLDGPLAFLRTGRAP